MTDEYFKYQFQPRIELTIQILMVGFGGILGTGQVEDQKMIKDKLINLMIIQFRLKLDKFYCIGVMN